MAKKEIIVDIDKTGEVQIEARGYSGNECLKATKSIEQALGGGVEERKMKKNHEIRVERESLNE